MFHSSVAGTPPQLTVFKCPTLAAPTQEIRLPKPGTPDAKFDDPFQFTRDLEPDGYAPLGTLYKSASLAVNADGKLFMEGLAPETDQNRLIVCMCSGLGAVGINDSTSYPHDTITTLSTLNPQDPQYVKTGIDRPFLLTGALGALSSTVQLDEPTQGITPYNNRYAVATRNQIYGFYSPAGQPEPNLPTLDVTKLPGWREGTIVDIASIPSFDDLRSSPTLYDAAAVVDCDGATHTFYMNYVEPNGVGGQAGNWPIVSVINSGVSLGTIGVVSVQGHTEHGFLAIRVEYTAPTWDSDNPQVGERTVRFRLEDCQDSTKYSEADLSIRVRIPPGVSFGFASYMPNVGAGTSSGFAYTSDTPLWLYKQTHTLPTSGTRQFDPDVHYTVDYRAPSNVPTRDWDFHTETFTIPDDNAYFLHTTYEIAYDPLPTHPPLFVLEAPHDVGTAAALLHTTLIRDGGGSTAGRVVCTVLHDPITHDLRLIEYRRADQQNTAQQGLGIYDRDGEPIYETPAVQVAPRFLPDVQQFAIGDPAQPTDVPDPLTFTASIPGILYTAAAMPTIEANNYEAQIDNEAFVLSPAHTREYTTRMLLQRDSATQLSFAPRNSGWGPICKQRRTQSQLSQAYGDGAYSVYVAGVVELAGILV